MKSMWMKLQQDNKGFSLVELLIAVAILAIVSGGTLLFMRQSSLTYNKTSTDVDVQTEAQLTANAITDRVIDCETQLKFYDGHESVTTDASGATVTVTDSYTATYVADGVTYTVQDHVLLLTNANSKTQSLIFWDKDRNVIYYNETSWDDTSSDWVAFNGSKAEMIAGNVSSFDVHTDKLNASKILDFDIEYSQQGKKYKGSYQVHMRNDVVEGTGATPSAPSGNTVTKVAVDPSTAYIIAKKNQGLVLPGTFRVSVSGSGALPRATWSVSADPSDTGVEPDSALVTEAQFGFKQTSLTIPDPTVKSFKLVATSIQDTSKSGYATIYVKKATGVNIEPTSELANNSDGKPATTKNSTLVFSGSTDGWNLTRSETGVTWKLYKSIANSAGSYSSWTEATNTDEAYISGSTVVLKEVNSNYCFKVEATSVFDPAVKGEYVFYITDNPVNVDLKFLRGLNIDLKSYFQANPMKIATDVISVLSIDSIEIESVSGYTGNYSEFMYFDSNYVLYVDYDAYNGSDLTKRREFYKEIKVGLKVKFKTSDGQQERETYVTLPAVQVIRVEPMIENIVVRKGNSTNIEVYVPGYNITSSSLMGVYIDGRKTSTSGSSSLNKYISCTMITNEGGSSILGNRNNGVTNGKFKLSAYSTESKYPVGSIPLKICVDDFYTVSSGDVLSYVQYNVYVANVEGSTQYIPGPGETDFPTVTTTNWGSTEEVPVPVSNVSTTGKINAKFKVSGSRYYMLYNETEYIYDTAYHYWKKTR